MLRMLTSAAAVLAVSTAMLLVPSTANALVVPTFGAIDASAAGHAKVTVTAPDSAYVAAWLRSPFGIDLTAPIFVPTDGGVAAFDLETWGLSTGYVFARPCGGLTVGTCGPAVASNPFAAKDVAPVITFPADDTIGVGQSYVVDAVDPDGGGALYADWVGQRTPLVRGGSKDLPLSADGAGNLPILRCSSTATSVCRLTGITHAIQVNKTLAAGVDQPTLPVINPALGARLHPVLRAWEGQDHAFALVWHVEDPTTHEVVPGVGATLEGLTLRDDDTIRPTIDVSGVTQNKIYALVMNLSYDDPDYGHLSKTLSWRFRIDTIAPAQATLSISEPWVYPFRDNYLDQTTLLWKHPFTEKSTFLIRITGPEDQVVREWRTTGSGDVDWHGTDKDGHLVLGGVYTASVTVTDVAGNALPPVTGAISVVRKKTELRSFKHTYTAAGSLADTFVGSCSVLKKPSNRGWAGSLGYYSNEKCTSTTEKSVVSTVHEARLPTAIEYRHVRVSVYGGASKRSTNHIAYVNYWGRDHDWSDPVMLLPSTGNHAGATVNGANYVFDDRYLVWGVFNVKGSHYDVKSFTVTAGYKVLVAE
jgi:hypothetical protein